LADIGLCPWEATKVRIQTQENWAKNLREGMPKLYGMIYSSFVFFFLIGLLNVLFIAEEGLIG
jgi:hypothetical protein